MSKSKRMKNVRKELGITSFVTNEALTTFDTIAIHKAQVSPVRHDKLEGRDYLVAPMAMFAEGVHNGSAGEVYYPEAEIAKTPEVWNHKPVVVYHPTMNGKPVSACDPAVLDTRKVGIILNTMFDGKLRAEAWMEPSRLKAVDPRILTALEKNEIMELSTGVFTDNEKVEGEWNGKKYKAIARNYRPDHLALLPDKVGAYSIADGAGLLQMNEENRSPDFLKQLVTRGLEAAMRCMVGPVTNDMSHNRIFSAVSTLLRGKYKSESDSCWVEDVYDTFFVYYHNGKLYRLKYLATDTEVTLVGEPEEVQRVTEYRTVEGTFVGNSTVGDNNPSTKETSMTKEQRIAHLLANGWVETDREFLTGLSDDKLEKLMKPAPASAVTPPVVPPTPEPNVNTGKPSPEAERIAALEARLTSLQVTINETDNVNKARIVQVLVANKRNQFTAEQLTAKPIAELRLLLNLAGDSIPSNFDGLGHPAPIGNSTPEEPIPTPKYSFGKKAG